VERMFKKLMKQKKQTKL